MLVRVLIVPLMTLTCLIAAAPAQDPSPGPVVYKGRRIATTMHYEGAPWLTRESREREEACSRLLKVLDAKPGDVVCDLGCGNGFYALPLAEQVGATGKILAVDIQPQMLEFLGDRANAAGVGDRIEPILGTLTDPKLPAGTVDMILLVDVYHELSHPEQMLAAMRKSLSPRGQIVLVEFRQEDPDVPIKPLHKMSKRQIFKELPPNGYRIARQFDGLPWQHVMFFERAPVGELADAARAALTRASPEGLPLELRSRIFMLTGNERVLGDDEPRLDTPAGLDQPAPDETSVRSAIETSDVRVLCEFLERADPAPPIGAGSR